MQTAIVIIIIGLFIFWGHYLNGVFDRKSIPDVLGLMFIGILLGPIFHLVDPASFGKFGPLFSNLVLIFILFESGTDLKIAEIKESFKESAGVTVIGFLTTWVVISVLCKIIFQLPVLTCLFIGATLGGTSSAVVAGLVKKIAIHPKTSATLIIESAETDVFTLAIPLSIITFMTTGQLATNVIISQFISSLVLALLIGVGGAFLWSFLINKFPNFKTTKFSTPAFLFILYGMAEYLNFSGPLTALSFGISIGNLKYLEPKIIEPIVPNQRIVLPDSEKDFFGQIVFLLRTFFFVFIGLNIQVNRIDWLIWGAVITFILFLIRILVVKLVVSKQAPVVDKAIISVMIPKGLGAAVVATLPLQQGLPFGDIIQAVCFSVILFSTLFCVGLFFLINTGIVMPFYSFVFKQKDTTQL
ncbi:MAG TPA: cation:proton antiporter [Bacteroidia bacterium]|jgi:cell volume regulation protein A|nr:cation:proton antiporter [Bacteroidia bacterium]